MKHKYSIFIIFIALAVSSCTGDDTKLTYEPGIYKPYKQEVSPFFAIADNKEIDGSLIKITDFPDKTGDILFVDMGTTLDDDHMREPILHSSIHLEKKNTARVYCPTCLDKPMQIRVKNDSLFMTPKNLREAVKFAPYSEIGAVIVRGEEAERHTTLRGKITEEGFIISSYNIFIKSFIIKRSMNDAYYLDLEYLKNELRENDTLVYVKKETYFRKQ